MQIVLFRHFNIKQTNKLIKKIIPKQLVYREKTIYTFE